MNPTHAELSRRERQIMEIVYRLGEASVADVAQRMPDNPGYGSVRVTLSILEDKGHVKHRQDGRRYIYLPTLSRERAKQVAVKNLLKTFFAGSPSKAILAMLDMSADRLSENELEEIAEWIESERE